MRRITIDPGVGGTGWAVWDYSWNLLDHGVINPPKLKGKPEEELNELNVWALKAAFIAEQVRVHCMTFGVTTIIIEWPSNFGGGGVAALTDATIKIAGLAGMIVGKSGRSFIELVAVNEWKGNLPKEVVIKRIKRILPNVKAKSHDWDSIGIGLYKKGVF